MAEYRIEKTFEKVDEEGFRCTKEVNETVNIYFLSASYTYETDEDGEIWLIPDNDKLFEPLWKYISRDAYDIQIYQGFSRWRKTHPVSIEIYVSDKETGNYYFLTPNSPMLTEAEYNFFYEQFKVQFPGIAWCDLNQSIEYEIESYLGSISSNDFVDGTTTELVSKLLIKEKDKICRSEFADFDCDLVESEVNRLINEGLRKLLEET